jgi:indoleamine 2,3-dioxygenase
MTTLLQIETSSIAVPLSLLAAHLEQKPYMEYSTSYALMNYAYVVHPLSDEQPKEDSLAGIVGMDYENLRLIRAFDGGEDEKGFM